MSLTGEQLIDEVRRNVGRDSTSDQGVITDTLINRYLNEAQKYIADEIPGLLALQFKNTTSVDFTQSLSYPLSDFTISGNTSDATRDINHLYTVFYLDGNDSRRLRFMHTDEFDKKAPDPTHSDMAFNKPFWWTRRSQSMEIFPLSACGFVDKDMRLDGDFYPRDFTVNDTLASDLSKADEGLIYYATAKAWEAIGGSNGLIQSDAWQLKFSNMETNKPGWLQEYKGKNDDLYEWDGDLFSDQNLSHSGNW